MHGQQNIKIPYKMQIFQSKSGQDTDGRVYVLVHLLVNWSRHWYSEYYFILVLENLLSEQGALKIQITMNMVY